MNNNAFHRHHPREYEGFTYAYPVLSRRSGGVSIGVNLNLDKACNFDCPYCQVNRTLPGKSAPNNEILERIRLEVESLLQFTDAQGVCRLPLFDSLPDSEKKVCDIALSGDGEPTMAPEFAEIASMLSELQTLYAHLHFKLVLITNATLLDKPKVQRGVEALLQKRGEVWAKLDAGSENWFQKINVSRISLDKIEANLQSLGKKYPFKIQSFIGSFAGKGWDAAEMQTYLARLQRLTLGGASITEVQLYTLARQPSDARISSVAPSVLETLQKQVENLGIKAVVYGMNVKEKEA